MMMKRHITGNVDLFVGNTNDNNANSINLARVLWKIFGLITLNITNKCCIVIDGINPVSNL